MELIVAASLSALAPVPSLAVDQRLEQTSEYTAKSISTLTKCLYTMFHSWFHSAATACWF
jgi:hypothetical protein